MASAYDATQQTQVSTQGIDSLGPTSYMIAGVKVEFPTKAYPSQIAMMNKVIQGLKQNRNCLLESPTGSGKTLALLCAALAWQRHEYVRVAEYNQAIDSRQQDVALQQSLQQQRQKEAEAAALDTVVGSNNEEKKVIKASPYFASSGITFDLTDDDDEDEDFKPTSKRPKSQIEDTIGFSSVGHQEIFLAAKPAAASRPSTSTSEAGLPYFVAPEKKLTVPKVFFCTRTHKQISQITRELRKTFYKTVRSVILASREHTCINPLLKGVANKNEHCRELLDNNSTLGDGCLYHQGARQFGTFNNLQSYGVLPGYDLEDFVKAGRTAKSCPYYATRLLMLQADIIFCPYNYIIDPNIRRSLKLDLSNQVIIFDEAHNMEDASRDAASFTLKQNEVIKAMQDCEKVKNIGGNEPYALGETAQMLSTFSTWIDSQINGLKDISYGTSGRFWTGTEAIAALQLSGLDEMSIKDYEDYFLAIMSQRDKDIEEMKERGLRMKLEKPTISSMSVSIIENVFRLFQDMYKNNGINRDDFRIALIKSNERRRRDGSTGPFEVFTAFTVNVWCLNPAIAFAEIRDAVHSIVLTSGTLSPMHSFESELGTPFALKLEASHVIDRNQVWAGVCGIGPTGVNLNGSYQNTESYAYQDEIGNVVQQVCDTMPYGVLCFFPSYRMLDTLVQRWKLTSKFESILNKKLIMIEPRTGVADFEKAMSDFYEAIKCCEQGLMGGITGALFLAVCRGKVSEGLDFSDNNARAVICVGIPFPNYRDMQVELKRDYNSKNQHKGLLPGSEWYEIQAFRALNQALGRCIRHRQDWGAILLIDDRYVKNPRYIQSLSKWIRSSVKNFEQFSPIINSFNSFLKEMSERPIPVETPFATQSNSENSALPRQGGGEVFDGENVVNFNSGFGTNSNSPGHGQGPREPLATFSGGFSPGITSNVADMEPEFLPNAAMSSSSRLGNKGPTNSNAQQKTPLSSTSKNRGKQFQLSMFNPNKPQPNIAAMFARQMEKPNQTPRDDSSSDSNRNKRGRDNKIKF